MAYDSSDTGTRQVYVVPYPGPGGKWTVSTDGGTMPRWARNGRELFYRNRGKMMAVDVQTSPAFRAGTPKLLFERSGGGGLLQGSGGIAYDVAPDGKRFLIVKPETAQKAQPDQVNVVVNWFEELRRRAPAGGK